MVDDMIFFRHINIAKCLLTLNDSAGSYALSLKLSPGISYSHANTRLIRLPKFEPAEAPKVPSDYQIEDPLNDDDVIESG